jgi:hypothetical protein
MHPKLGVLIGDEDGWLMIQSRVAEASRLGSKP